MACVCLRVHPTAAGARRVTWVSTVKGERSQPPAGGTSACTGNAEWTRVEILRATASLDTQAATVIPVWCIYIYIIYKNIFNSGYAAAVIPHISKH